MMAILASMRRSYEGLVSTGTFLQHLFLFSLRIYWGYLFQAAGMAKFQHITEIGDTFASLGIPLAHFMAYVVLIIEFIGGWCLILGFASRLMSIPLIFIMVTALLTVHHAETSLALAEPAKFLSASPTTYLLASLVIFFFGPGWLSIDYLLETIFFRKKNRVK